MMGRAEVLTASMSWILNMKASVQGRIVVMPIRTVIHIVWGTFLPGCGTSSAIWVALSTARNVYIA